MIGQFFIDTVNDPVNNTIVWCTVSENEQNKCEAFSRVVEREKFLFENNYMFVRCKQAFSKEECMTILDQESTAITTMDAGEVFLAGRYHSAIPIMQEIYDNNINYQYAVAVIKDGTLSDVQTLHDLRGKKACFAGVGTLAGWAIPINTVSIYIMALLFPYGVTIFFTFVFFLLLVCLIYTHTHTHTHLFSSYPITSYPLIL